MNYELRKLLGWNWSWKKSLIPFLLSKLSMVWTLFCNINIRSIFLEAIFLSHSSIFFVAFQTTNSTSGIPKAAITIHKAGEINENVFILFHFCRLRPSLSGPLFKKMWHSERTMEKKKKERRSEWRCLLSIVTSETRIQSERFLRSVEPATLRAWSSINFNIKLVVLRVAIYYIVKSGVPAFLSEFSEVTAMLASWKRERLKVKLWAAHMLSSNETKIQWSMFWLMDKFGKKWALGNGIGSPPSPLSLPRIKSNRLAGSRFAGHLENETSWQIMLNDKY